MSWWMVGMVPQDSEVTYARNVPTFVRRRCVRNDVVGLHLHGSLATFRSLCLACR